MKYYGALLALLTLACCAGPQPEAADETTVFGPGAVCRVGHDGGSAIADRGIGGTGIAARTRTTDRGIGGTGIFGVVTGFASICVDGLEVRFDKNVPVSVNGSAATLKQLRVGQVVVIEAGGRETAGYSADQATMIAVRYEVSGPIDAVDAAAGAMIVAGQRVMVLPTTWVAARFGIGNWVTVSGLRQPDGTVMASRLDRARAGALFVRGQIIREGDTVRIGGLVLHGAPATVAKSGAFVSIAGTYADRTAEVRSIDADPLSEDPAGYFGTSAGQVIVQGFVRVRRGTVWLNNGRSFPAGADVQGKGNTYRNAVIRLERTASGAFVATELHYTAYRGQPADVPARSRGRGAGNLILPPEAPPGPPADKAIPDAPDGNTGINDVPDSSPGEPLISNAAPPPDGSADTRRSVGDRTFTLPGRLIAALD
nr:DUF5666 domain-containing protein [uncultured Rhodopila sp.]